MGYGLIDMLVTHGIALLVGLVLGWAGRKYALKRNPEATARLDAEAKRWAQEQVWGKLPPEVAREFMELRDKVSKIAAQKLPPEQPSETKP